MLYFLCCGTDLLCKHSVLHLFVIWLSKKMHPKIFTATHYIKVMCFCCSQPICKGDISLFGHILSLKTTWNNWQQTDRLKSWPLFPSVFIAAFLVVLCFLLNLIIVCFGMPQGATLFWSRAISCVISPSSGKFKLEHVFQLYSANSLWEHTVLTVVFFRRIVYLFWCKVLFNFLDLNL